MPRKVDTVAYLYLAAVLLLIVAAGLTKLHQPLVGDPTLFLMGAQTIAAGGVLYRDFWDIKPPGIFLWYLAGGKLFGFSDVGMHWFDLLYQCTFAAVMIFGLRSLVGPRVAALAALFTVGWYYAFSNVAQFQLEPLVQLPIFVSLAALARSRSSPAPGRWLLLAGLGAGVVIVFKPVLLLVPFALCLLWLRTRREWLLTGLGAVVPPAFTLLWFAAQGAVPDLLDAVFRAPAEIVAQQGSHPLKLLIAHGVRWLKRVSGLIVLGLAAFYFRRDRLTMSCGIWILTGLAAILLQVRSWWVWHWALLICPLSILSALSVDEFLKLLDTSLRRWAAAVLVAVAAIPIARRVAAANPDPRTNPFFQATQEEVRFVARQPAGPVLVIACPEIYYRSGRKPPTAVHSGPNAWSRSQMQRLCAEVRRSSPVLAFVPTWVNLTRLPDDCLLQLLRDYREVRRSLIGSWLQSRPDTFTRVRPDE